MLPLSIRLPIVEELTRSPSTGFLKAFEMGPISGLWTRDGGMLSLGSFGATIVAVSEDIVGASPLKARAGISWLSAWIGRGGSWNSEVGLGLCMDSLAGGCAAGTCPRDALRAGYETTGD